VVHLEGEDAACIAGVQGEEDEKEEEEEEEEEEFRGMERRHVSLLLKEGVDILERKICI